MKARDEAHVSLIMKMERKESLMVMGEAHALAHLKTINDMKNEG